MQVNFVFLNELATFFSLTFIPLDLVFLLTCVRFCHLSPKYFELHLGENKTCTKEIYRVHKIFLISTKVFNMKGRNRERVKEAKTKGQRHRRNRDEDRNKDNDKQRQKAQRQKQCCSHRKNCYYWLVEKRTQLSEG